MFEKRLAALEGAERAVATSSGMAAIMAVAMSFLKLGDHVICSRAVFGSTVSLFEKYVAKFGVTVDFVDLTDLDAWKNAVKPKLNCSLLSLRRILWLKWQTFKHLLISHMPMAHF